MRIAIDIDSTLHHYWDAASAAAKRRFGVELPYEEQFDWAITPPAPRAAPGLRRGDALRRGDPVGRALPGRRRDGATAGTTAGHFIHITSHRAERCHEATAAWLDAIGLPYDELYCSFDKVSRCGELGIDVLVDDSPVNIAARHRAAGSSAATIVPPVERGGLRGGGRHLRGRLAGARAPALDAAELERLDAGACLNRPGCRSHDGTTAVASASATAPTDGARPGRRPDDAPAAGVEPERQLNDWGRSERVEGLFDRTVVDFLYRLWFRCEVEGIENVPARRAARCSSPTTPARCRPTRR